MANGHEYKIVSQTKTITNFPEEQRINNTICASYEVENDRPRNTIIIYIFHLDDGRQERTHSPTTRNWPHNLIVNSCTFSRMKFRANEKKWKIVTTRPCGADDEVSQRILPCVALARTNVIRVHKGNPCACVCMCECV